MPVLNPGRTDAEAVLHDGDLAAAIIIRLLERGTHFEMRGRSYRTRHLKPDPSQEIPPPAAATAPP